MLFNYLPKPSSSLSAALIALSAVGFVMSIQGCRQALEQGGSAQVPMQKLAIAGSEASATGSPFEKKTSVTPQAERALSARQAALEAREVHINRQYRQAQQVCHTQFFVNPCLKKAHMHFRQEKAALRADQLELEEAKRAKRVHERHQKAMLQQPAPNKKSFRQHVERNTQRAAQKPYASHQSRGKAQSAHPLQHAQDAEQRAENIRRFEAKQRAAERHRLLMERRREARKRANTVSATNAMPDITPSSMDLSQ